MDEPPPRDRPMRTRRLPRCPGCALPHSLCLCAELPRIVTRTEIVLVMHHSEAHKPTNTGRLAGRVLTRARVTRRGDEAAGAQTTGTRLLLFPLVGARTLSARDGEGPLTLVVPDGTWRQARRICHREQVAGGAEAVMLPPGPPGRYGGLRCTALEGALCTFEAVARALGVLEGAAVEAELMAVLDEFVRRSLKTRAGHVVRAV